MDRRETEGETRAQAVKEAVIVLALLCVSVAFAYTDHRELAAAALAGALTLATPPRRRAPVAIAALGVVAALSVAGCATVAAVVKPTCAGVRLLNATCDIVEPLVP